LERKAKVMAKRREHLGFDPEEMIESLFAPVESEPDAAPAAA
jgi:hypothetical protein